jgi:hypothetical protein
VGPCPWVFNRNARRTSDYGTIERSPIANRPQLAIPSLNARSPKNALAYQRIPHVIAAEHHDDQTDGHGIHTKRPYAGKRPAALVLWIGEAYSVENGCRVLYRAEVTIARISGTPLARKPNKDGVPVLQRK